MSGWVPPALFHSSTAPLAGQLCERKTEARDSVAADGARFDIKPVEADHGAAFTMVHSDMRTPPGSSLAERTSKP